MSTKKHGDHPHLTGEYRWGDRGQLILLVLFLGIWISDSFVFHYSDFLKEKVTLFIRFPAATLILLLAWHLARNGMRMVFGTPRDKAEVISTGVLSRLRHPIYTGALLLYLAAIAFTLSLASLAFWCLILVFYTLIARYEEKILTREFGEDYIQYKAKAGMLWPKFRS